MNHNSARKMRGSLARSPGPCSGLLASKLGSLQLVLHGADGRTGKNALLVCNCGAQSPRLLPIAFWTKTQTLNTVCRAPGVSSLPTSPAAFLPLCSPLKCHIPHTPSCFQLLKQLVEPFRAFMNPYFKCTTLLRQTHFGEDWVSSNLTEKASKRDACFPHIMI